MINIPTELLRTLIAVVDYKSFTKAANALGITQPAVSAQIKRLQILLDAEVFDKTEAGVVLTAVGDAVVTYARRMLALNDQILQVAAPPPVSRRLRIGMTGDFFSPYLACALVNFRKQWPHRKFQVTMGTSPQLLHELRAGELDLVCSLTMSKPERDARHHWTEEMVWCRGAIADDKVADTVPLISRDEDWMNHSVAIDALEKAGRAYEIALIAPTFALLNAVRNGLGVIAFVRRRVTPADLVICNDLSLPRLPNLVASIYVSEAGETDALNVLADDIAATVMRGTDPMLPRQLRLNALINSDE